jgi:hypothetical protein
MHNTFVRATSRVLIVCLAAVSFQAQAGMIGTGDAVASAQAQAAQLYGTRAALVGQLATFGISADAARDRVAALSDAEVAQLAGQLDSLPAGAVSGLAVGFALVVIFLIWRFNFSDQAKAEAKKEPAKKQ